MLVPGSLLPFPLGMFVLFLLFAAVLFTAFLPAVTLNHLVDGLAVATAFYPVAAGLFVLRLKLHN